ncbi:MAG: biotin attachment protein [Proteobacteria bacterium]|nr:biotin attachment protein [Pseudomonadota bacterium]
MITAFRDGFQSVYGARVFTEDFMPAVEAARVAGISHFEAGGGARFQSLYFYCNQDAFDMMDEFRKAAGPDADLQTLARGTNVVGLESQSSDVIKLHAELFKKHSITTIRNFDALNDVNNLIYSGKCIHEAGLKHEVVVTMMSLPPGIPGGDKIHTADYYTSVLRDILDAEIPYDSVCFKDASGTATPKSVYDTIKQARKLLPENTKLVFHTHDTAGTGTMCYQAALDAGTDGIDLSMAPASGGTCQTDVLTMWHALRGTDYDLGIDFDKMREAEAVFKECMSDYFLPPESKAVEPLTPLSPMPGGALTANTQMMRDNNLMDKYPDVINAMREVVELGGFGTSVTPVSQFYFQQAFNNVMLGKWKKIADGYGKMVLGYFGKTPIKPAPEVIKAAEEQFGMKFTTKTPLELNDADPTKGLPVARKMLEAEGLPTTDENVFIAATCKEKGILYLKGQGLIGVRKNKPEEKAPVVEPKKTSGSGGSYSVDVDSKTYSVVVRGDEATVNGKVYKINVKESGGQAVAATSPQPSQAAQEDIAIKAELPGSVVLVQAKEGDRVDAGKAILLVEAMKMEVWISAPKAGVITSIGVARGDQVTPGQTLVTISPT